MAIFNSLADRSGTSAVSAMLAGCLIFGALFPCRLLANEVPRSLDLVEMSSSDGAVLKKLDDGSILVTGKDAYKDTYVVVAHSALKKITGLRLEVLKHESLPGGGPRRLFKGTPILSLVEISAAPQKPIAPARAVALKSATADFTQQGHSVLNLIDGKPGPGWAIWDGATAKRRVDFQLEKPLELESGVKLTITLKHESVLAGRNLGHFRLSVSDVDSDKIDPRALVTKADREAVTSRAVDAPTMQIAFTCIYRTLPQYDNVEISVTRDSISTPTTAQSAESPPRPRTSSRPKSVPLSLCVPLSN